MFICFVREHLAQPIQALALLRRLIRPRRTIIVIDGVRAAAICEGMITPQRFDAGVSDLHRTIKADGMFIYTFFKAVGFVLRSSTRSGPNSVMVVPIRTLNG